MNVGKKMLQALGYAVHTAKSGEEAIGIYKKNREKIDLVILDMIMPLMSGGETYRVLKNINPQIKVILSSGYSMNGEASKILASGYNGFIQKPFNIMNLSKKIREVLG
jgi:CheY-like chemotaxis protein